MMKFLVTGAAGFIGYHVVNRLIADGHEVVGIDNLCDRSTIGIKLARLANLGIDTAAIANGEPIRSVKGSFTFIKQDILDRDAVIKLCTEGHFNKIIHLAALVGIASSIKTPQAFFDVNVAGTQNLLEAARISGISHFFFPPALWYMVPMPTHQSRKTMMLMNP